MRWAPGLHLGGQQRGPARDERDVGRGGGRRLEEGARPALQLLPLGEDLFVEPNPVPVKAALSMMGRIADELRPPLYPLSAANREKVRSALQRSGIL